MVSAKSFQEHKFYLLDDDIRLIEQQLDENPGTWVPYFMRTLAKLCLATLWSRTKVVHKTAVELVSVAEPLTKKRR